MPQFGEVRFPKDKQTVYKGRNGLGKCIGISIYRSYYEAPLIELNPINSKEGISNSARLEIPVECVSELCTKMHGDVIQKIFDRLGDQIPMLLGVDDYLDTLIEQRLKGESNAGISGTVPREDDT